MIAEDTDLISVYIITHNRFRLLKRSLESVRNQLYKNLEIIVVDDFSRDETSQYVKQKCNEDKRIIYVRNEKIWGHAIVEILLFKWQKESILQVLMMMIIFFLRGF